MIYLATFFSHFGAIRYKKLCEQQALCARTMPVPRDLSSSCGTCVRVEGSYVEPTGICADEIEKIVCQTANGYETVYEKKGE